MKLGNSSNWVHWLYATLTGTATSIDFSILGLSNSSRFFMARSFPPLRASDTVRRGKHGFFVGGMPGNPWTYLFIRSDAPHGPAPAPRWEAERFKRFFDRVAGFGF